jgi:transketolase
VKAVFAACAEQGGEQRKAWDARRDAFVGKGGEAAELYDRLMGRKAPSDLLEQLLAAVPEKDGATRALAGAIQQRAAELVPSLVGGSADLTGSTKTYIKDASDVGPGSFGGRNFYFGVREHGMAAMANGMALGDGFIPYVATFMVFSDYLRPALRLAGLSKIQSVYVLTHDSMYLGEDGPTHQPVEHYWALRCIPNVDLWRPCDAVECAAAWTAAVERRDGPTAMALTRQGVPKMTRPDGFSPRDMLKGAYTIAEADGDPAVVIIATGSEVAVAVEAKQLLGDAGTGVRVVSAPCWDAFLRQDDAYRDAVIPKGTRRVAIELGVTWPWRGVVGDDGLVIGHDGFGFSAPWKTIRDELGHSPEKVAERIRSWMG